LHFIGPHPISCVSSGQPEKRKQKAKSQCRQGQQETIEGQPSFPGPTTLPPQPVKLESSWCVDELGFAEIKPKSFCATAPGVGSAETAPLSHTTKFPFLPSDY
jgi:hypothetical protein